MGLSLEEQQIDVNLSPMDSEGRRPARWRMMGEAGLEFTFSVSIPQRIDYMEAMQTGQENTSSSIIYIM